MKNPADTSGVFISFRSGHGLAFQRSRIRLSMPGVASTATASTMSSHDSATQPTRSRQRFRTSTAQTFTATFASGDTAHPAAASAIRSRSPDSGV